MNKLRKEGMLRRARGLVSVPVSQAADAEEGGHSAAPVSTPTRKKQSLIADV